MISSITLFDDILFDGLKELNKILKEKNKKVGFSEIMNTEQIDITNRKVIGNFISNNSDLVHELKNTQELIENYFKKEEKKRPLNILLSASPGSGKSFLLKQFKEVLETKYKTEFKEFNLSTLISKEEIFSIFRYIKERNENGITPIVFIDEVDTLVNGEYIFPFLISAMSDGESKYLLESIECSQAILAFAGSGLFESKDTEHTNIAIPVYNNFYVKIFYEFLDLLKTLKEKQTFFDWRDNKIKSLKNKAHLINKFSDFLDRIDLFLMLPPTHLKLANYSIEQELTDLSVSLIKKHFKKINKIELSYLLVIMTLTLTFETKREAESVIFLTTNTGGNVLKFNNLPYSIMHKFEPKFGKYNGKEIEIKAK